jgi:ketosteroid isomerase-like protein
MVSNVELMKGLFARFNETGEIDFSQVDPEVELHPRPDVPDGQVWRGVEGVRGFFAETAKAFDPIRWEPQEFIPAGRHVLVRARIVAFGAASGTPIEVDESQVWTFRDGLIVRLQAFPTFEEAQAAAQTLDEEVGE